MTLNFENAQFLIVLAQKDNKQSSQYVHLIMKIYEFHLIHCTGKFHNCIFTRELFQANVRSRKGNARGITGFSTKRVHKDSQGKDYVTFFTALFGYFDHGTPPPVTNKTK